MAATRGTHPMLPLTWLAIAALLVGRPQPVVLGLVAVAWGFSMVFLIPGIQLVLGGDPLALLLSGSWVETLAQAIVRVLLLITAWNQFLFYRLLYGTQAATGLDPTLEPIPEVLPNPSARASLASRGIGFIGIMSALMAVPLYGSGAGSLLLGLNYGCSVFATGLGLGSAFVPNQHRGIALAGVLLGCLGLIAGLIVGRALYA